MPRPELIVEAEPHISARNLALLGRDDLIRLYNRNQALFNEWVRRMVIQGRRVDILAEVVLGYKVAPVHRAMLLHQATHPESLLLVFRGAGKTTMCTIAWSIFLILLNRNVRILIASKTHANAIDFLKEIKRHFESNERLREIFGDFVGEHRWEGTSIEVKGRKLPSKEPTVNTIGWEGAIASKHYNAILADDLVDEDNARTKFQREKMLDWYYKALTPTLLPADGSLYSGEMHIIGTRYHFDDLYGHLQEVQPDGTGGELKGEKTLIIPALTPEGESSWTERFAADALKATKRKMGLIRFNSQYQCDTEAMKGQIFRYDDCQIVDDNEIPTGLRVFMGVDLAISESEAADMFAIVVIGRDSSEHIFILDYIETQLRFPEQTKMIIEMGKRHNPIRTGLEINAYQKAQLHQLRKSCPALNVLPVTTTKDKVTRAWNLAKHFESGRVHFRKHHSSLIEHLVLFPSYRYKDLFDALDLAVTASEARLRKNRREEPGLL